MKIKGVFLLLMFVLISFFGMMMKVPINNHEVLAQTGRQNGFNIPKEFLLDYEAKENLYPESRLSEELSQKLFSLGIASIVLGFFLTEPKFISNIWGRIGNSSNKSNIKSNVYRFINRLL